MNEDRDRLTARDIPDAAFDKRRAEEAAERASAKTETARATANAEAAAAATEQLFDADEAGGFRTRWEAIQTGFVDSPRAAVQQADALVADITNRLTEVFTKERSTLEGQWDRGDDVSTEDLRLALKRYRSFFERLLSL